MNTYVIITYRVFSIMFLFLVATLLTGRRNMGELPVFDVLVLLTLGSVVGADIAEPEIKHLPVAYALVLIMLLQYLHGAVVVKSRRLGKLFTFEPVVVIEKGEFVKGNMRRIKYSVDTVLTLLRDKNIFDISQVEYAIVESTGQLSVLKRARFQPPAAYALGLEPSDQGLPVTLIVEGKLYQENLDRLKLSQKWLMEQLAAYNIQRVEQVFYAELYTNGQLYVSKGLEHTDPLSRLRH